MNRRGFFQNSFFTALGAKTYSEWLDWRGPLTNQPNNFNSKKAKNIIFMVSDGMSMGTLTLSDLYLQRKEGRGSNWLDLYRNQQVKRCLMDTASASSLVTDSAAGSSSWGCGHRVPNGHLNIGMNGEVFTPILQKFKYAGKKVGCVTTVPITHATPAGFCVNFSSRNAQPDIALTYKDLRFDVMLGGGGKYWNKREDNRNVLQECKSADFHAIEHADQLSKVDASKPIIGVFDNDALPYTVDSDENKTKNIPSLATLTKQAIQFLNTGTEGFVLQVEGGKVDWAAHSNDAPAIVYDQVAFDEAIKVAIDFANKDGNTLVVITTDHGNGNPGLFYGSKADKSFEKIFTMSASNDTVLRGIKRNDSVDSIIQRVEALQGIVIDQEDAQIIKSKLLYLSDDEMSDPYKLPFFEYSQIIAKHTFIHFASMEHSSDMVELAMYGPGSDNLPSFIENYKIHQFLLTAAEVANKW